MAAMVVVVEGYPDPQLGPGNPLFILSHLLMGQDPAGPPRLFDDDLDDFDDEATFEDDLDDIDGDPFSFLG